MSGSIGRRLLGLSAVALLVLAACGSDDSGDSSASTAPSATDAATTAASTATTADALANLDKNGDGKVVFGIATPGPRNDGAYYQALVDGVTKFSEDQGFEAPVVVDNIPAAEAATQLDSLARQGVDAVMVGASQIADPLNTLIPKYPDLIWYCNCGAGFQDETKQLIQSLDDSSEISYTAGVATGLLMKERGQTKAAFIGNNNFDFEQEAFRAFELGLKSVDPSFEWTYIPTGSFNDVAAATEAFNTAYAGGVRAIYPFLGGAQEAVTKLANEKGDVIVLNPGSSKACDRTDVKYDVQVRFDAGDYVQPVLNELLEGKLTPGTVRTFKVGVDPEPGAE